MDRPDSDLSRRLMGAASFFMTMFARDLFAEATAPQPGEAPAAAPTQIEQPPNRPESHASLTRVSLA